MEKLQNYHSEAGIAVYPWITKADTKFNPGGDYRTKLRMPRKAAEKMIEQIEAVRNTALAEAKAKTKKPPKEAPVPYSTVYDDDGNETDDVEFSFKTKATITTKDGKTLKKTVKVFDSKLQPLPEGVDVYGGSKIKVAYQIVPYSVAAVGTGVSLRMAAVQVIDLVSSGGGTGSSYGFGEEDGYVAEKAPKDDATEASDEDHSDNEEDF